LFFYSDEYGKSLGWKRFARAQSGEHKTFKIKKAEVNAVSYRLRNNTRPLQYDLWVQTDVEKMNYSFSGRVKIKIIAIEATDYVTLPQYCSATIHYVHSLEGTFRIYATLCFSPRAITTMNEEFQHFIYIFCKVFWYSTNEIRSSSCLTFNVTNESACRTQSAMR
jgi:hypothetical protein